MSKPYRRLLPATGLKEEKEGGANSAARSSGSFPTTPAPKVSKKRVQVSVACEVCRAKKSGCDGKRPSCTPCQRRRKICVYPPENSQSVAIARLRDKLRVSERENGQLRKLLRLVGQLPAEHLKQEILQFSDDIKDISVLLDRVQRMVFATQQIPEINATSPHESNSGSSTRTLAIDLKALTHSLFRVSARPWTTVAGDGLVSDLVSAFFVWDDAFFFPFIDREAFLSDMRSGDVENAKYCSPFLVNAICASRCFTSQAAKALGACSGVDIGIKFWHEAKRMWALEGDRPSISSMQALGIMFTVSAFLGQDRLGSVYRYASYNMLNRLDLTSAYAAANKDEQLIYSKILWGLFCFESIVAYVYLQQSLIPPPTIPRRPSATPTSSDSTLPGGIPEILDATCQLSEALYKVMQLNSSTEDPGSDEDLSTRKHLYDTVTKWLGLLPPKLNPHDNYTHQTCFLRIYADEVLISILRPLHSATVLDWTTPPTTVRSMLFQLANNSALLSKRFVDTFSLREYTCMTLCGMYNSLLILVEQLDDPKTHPVFIDICMMIRQTAKDFPMAHYILQAIFALACQLDLPIPARAVAYIQESDKKREQLEDLPIGFIIPQTENMKALLLTTRDEGENDAIIDMGHLLAKWSRMSI